MLEWKDLCVYISVISLILLTICIISIDDKLILIQSYNNSNSIEKNNSQILQLYILSYVAMEIFRRSRGHHKNWCNVLRLNTKMNITQKIHYIGGMDVKSEWQHFDKVLYTHKYLKYFMKINNFTIYESKNNIIILFVDGFDLLFQRNSSHILQQFLDLNNNPQFNNKIIISSEINCWPPIDIICNNTNYPHTINKYNPSKYLNAGAIIGYLHNIFIFYSQLTTILNNRNIYAASKQLQLTDILKWYDDQALIQYFFINNLSNIILDYNSYIFQSMFLMENTSKLPLNKINGYYNYNNHYPNISDHIHYPSIIHFNSGNTFKRVVSFGEIPLLNTGAINGSITITITDTHLNTKRFKYSELCHPFEGYYF